MAELDAQAGISVWLVEAKAVRIADSPWAPLFTTVVEPNAFTAVVEQVKQTERVSEGEFWAQFESDEQRDLVHGLVERWLAVGHRRRFAHTHVVLEARGPSASRIRTVVAVYLDGRVMVPFASYAGMNSGIPIVPLTTEEFRSRADRLFGFGGTEQVARTTPGWLTAATTEPLMKFCAEVAGAYDVAMNSEAGPSTTIE